MTESTFVPDDTRRLQLQGFIGQVCVNSTGRLGIVTHVYIQSGGWACGGFGLDGKGVWSSGQPIEISSAEAFFNKLTERFNGRLSYLDTVTHSEMRQIADMVATRMGDARETQSIPFEFESDCVRRDEERNGEEYVMLRVDRDAANLSAGDFHATFVEPTRLAFDQVGRPCANGLGLDGSAQVIGGDLVVEGDYINDQPSSPTGGPGFG